MDSSSKAFSEVVLEMLGVNSSLTRSSRKKFLPEILEFESLREVLKRLDSSSKRMNALDGQIRDASCKLEDVLESHVLNQFLSQSEILGEESHPLSFSLDLQEIKQDIDSFTQTVKKLKEEYIKELSNPLSEEDDAVSSRIDFGVKKSNLVGLSHELIYFKHLLLRGLSKELEIVSILGMAGIGKTTLAKEIFEDPLILRHFNCRAWVTVGPKYQLKEILQSILAQVNPDIAKLLTEGDEELADLKRMMYESLKGRRYLIVLDDIWKRPVWDDLKFPKKKNGNRILLTTRLEEVAHSASFVNTCRKSFLNKEESWYLLREKVFGKELCPPELEKAGKKIAENCEGLPLTIVTVGDLLSKDEKTPEYWKKVAEKENSIFMDANDQMYKVLFLSYNYLPQHLKACFLYMGVFPQNYEIPLSKLINLWRAEGFLEPEPFATSEYFALECLRGLVSRSIVMVRQNTSRNGIKTCGLHSAFWHLCIREAGKNKFLHVLNSYADGLAEDIKSQRRLCIHKSILFGIKDVYKSMASISTARFLLCTGPPHQYPVPICFGLRLLRVLDALSLRFYEFPIEVLKLVQLRYLALTYNGKLPASISKLWNLLCLIVYRHLSIKSSGAPSYLPVEIWDMQEVKHLQIMGSDLPDPCGALLPNLLTLLDVSAHSCTKGVLERIPNLKKLGIRIELAPDAAEPLCCFDHISHLDELESLKCVIVNPILRSEVAAPPPPLSIFPSGLKKLTLSGFGYPWEELSKIASLPNLEVFKLQCYAFRGPKWETCRWGFPQLKVLLIEDNDLVHWTVGHDSFPWLEHLSIICCYKLEQIPRQFAYGSLRMIELIDCNPLAVTRAKQIKEIGEKARDYLDVYIDVRVHSSWDDGHLKS
ncbi:hypothetical protein Pfo_020887 [Paulownia fortunei]|nr:hypothetical protein Pfo_020887 [Paulownia fortunei]